LIKDLRSSLGNLKGLEKRNQRGKRGDLKSLEVLESCLLTVAVVLWNDFENYDLLTLMGGGEGGGSEKHRNSKNEIDRRYWRTIMHLVDDKGTARL